jgi:hypothetical protein
MRLREFTKNFWIGSPSITFCLAFTRGLGRCYEKLGQKDEAIKIYQQMSHFYSGQLWKDMAEARIKALSPTQ